MATRDEIIRKLKEVYDPEIFIDVYNLGLIYDISIDKGKTGDIIKITMTLTFSGCPLGGLITKMVEEKLRELNDVEDVIITLTFDPPWSRDMIKDEEIKKRFGIQPRA